MNPDDDLYLSAYLDGELNPEQRAKVDFALQALPDLSDRCRDLGKVGEMVSGLSRPAADRDQSAAILAELYRRRSVFYWLGWFERPPLTKSLALFGSAALLVAFAAIGLSVATHLMNGPAAHFELATILPKAPAVANGEVVAVTLESDKGKLAESISPVAPTVVDPARDREAAEFRAILQGGIPSELFVVNDVVGGDASGKVGRHLKGSARRHDKFARVNLVPRNQVEPARSGETAVFVVVLDPVELKALRNELKTLFRQNLTVDKLEPRILAQLAGVDSPFIERGEQVAKVIVPDEKSRASLSEPAPRDEPKFAFVKPGAPVMPIAENLESRPAPSDQTNPAATAAPQPSAPPTGTAKTPATASLDSEDSVVVVWVRTLGGNLLPRSR